MYLMYANTFLLVIYSLNIPCTSLYNATHHNHHLTSSLNSSVLAKAPVQSLAVVGSIELATQGCFH